MSPRPLVGLHSEPTLRLKACLRGILVLHVPGLGPPLPCPHPGLLVGLGDGRPDSLRHPDRRAPLPLTALDMASCTQGLRKTCSENCRSDVGRPGPAYCAQSCTAHALQVCRAHRQPVYSQTPLLRVIMVLLVGVPCHWPRRHLSATRSPCFLRTASFTSVWLLLLH